MTKLRTLLIAAALVGTFGLGYSTLPAKAHLSAPTIQAAADVQNAQWRHGRHWRHRGNHWGPRVHWGPRCRWVERRVWSPRLHRNVWRQVRTCR